MKANSGLSGLSGLCSAVVAVGANAPGFASSSTWSDPANVTSSDDSRASVTLTASGSAGALIATGFGFAIPTGMAITGIAVRIERSKSGAGVINDTTVSLYRDTAPAGTAKHDGDDWPAVDTVVTYGTSADLWGTTWTPTQINDGGFGVQLDATEAGVDAITLLVDHITLTVWYQ